MSSPEKKRRKDRRSPRSRGDGQAPRFPLAALARREIRIALNACRELGRPAAYRLAVDLEAWANGDPREPENRPRRAGVDPQALAIALALVPRSSELAAAEERRATELGARIFTLSDEGYPPALRDLALPPPVLYVRGEFAGDAAVTIVGSRKADLYGTEVAGLFAKELAAAGVAVVSGFAQGIDLAAHRGALAADQGRTIAVLGCGLAIDYPRGQRRLASQIAERGAVVSEFPPDTAPASWQFPIRNRILAALSQGTLVVRARARSGSLITARHALELGRDVYAIPGRIFEDGSFGPNGLIRAGAHLVQHPREILEALGLATTVPTAASAGPTAPTDALLEALPPAEERSVEELANALKKTVPEMMAELLNAELAGRVRRLPGGSFARRIT